MGRDPLTPTIGRLTELLGRPVATPALGYRVFRWDCPVCRAGDLDPNRIYRPFWVDSEGRLGCNSCDASVYTLAAALRGRTPSMRYSPEFIREVDRMEAMLDGRATRQAVE